MTPVAFLIACLPTGLMIAAWVLEEFSREMERDAGLGLIPSGNAVSAVLVLVFSPLFLAAGLAADWGPVRRG